MSGLGLSLEDEIKVSFVKIGYSNENYGGFFFFFGYASLENIHLRVPWQVQEGTKPGRDTEI